MWQRHERNDGVLDRRRGALKALSLVEDGDAMGRNGHMGLQVKVPNRRIQTSPLYPAGTTEEDAEEDANAEAEAQ